MKKRLCYMSYILIIAGALSIYYGYLSEGCLCFSKVFYPITVGWLLLITGLVMLK